MANYVWISSAKGEAVNLEENYFDMMPGEEKTVEIPAELAGGDISVSCYQMEMLR